MKNDFNKLYEHYEIRDGYDNSIKVLIKFHLLLQRIEDTNPYIDDPEFIWVENIIEKMEDGYTPTKNDLLTANLYWNKWEKQ